METNAFGGQKYRGMSGPVTPTPSFPPAPKAFYPGPKETTVLQLDSIDHKILALLQADGRISNQALADKVGLSPSACLRRVRALEEAGVVAGYRAQLDARVLGLDVDAFVQVTMRQEVEGWHDSFMAAVQRWPQVVGAWIVTGECNYLLRIRAKNLQEYSQFAIEHLHKERGVKEIRSNIVMQGIKSGETTVPLALVRD